MSGLYVHVPFCSGKCPYCGFFSVDCAGDSGYRRKKEFLHWLRKEMAIRAFEPEFKEYIFDTIYIGGGTPSVLGTELMVELISDLRYFFRFSPDPEFTVEVNPGDNLREFLPALRALGVNRINIGCQSFDDGVLCFLGRRHSSQQAIQAFLLAREAGFKNTGIDLIYGIPALRKQVESTPDIFDRLFEGWLSTLKKVIELGPEHISCYQLTIEPGTPLEEIHRSGELLMPDEELQARYFFRTSRLLERAGYLHYEISNFALDDRFVSRHNFKYWTHVPYIGLGPSAHSFDGWVRSWNVRTLEKYVDALSSSSLPLESFERLSEEELQTESIFLGLRTSRGIELEKFRRRFGRDLLAERGEFLEYLEKKGFIELRDGFLKPSLSGMAVADNLSACL